MSYWVNEGIAINLDKVSHVTQAINPRTGKQGVKVHFIESREDDEGLFLEGSQADRLFSSLRSKSQSDLQSMVIDFEELFEQIDQERDNPSDLSRVELQNMLQKVQQLLTLMSNVSKTMHDTSMAVIRKIA